MEIYEGCPLFNSNLWNIKANIRGKNWDWFNVNTGMEGGGKSNLGLYACSIIDENFTLKHAVKDLKSFSDAVADCDRGQAILMDEASLILFSRNWNSWDSREMVQDIMVMRALNLFIWANITDVRYLDVYIREGRLRSMTNVITYDIPGEYNGRSVTYRERGIFEVYSRATVINHFREESKNHLIPEFIEPYPDIRELGPEGRALWVEYERYKDDLIAERKEAKNKRRKEHTEESERLTNNELRNIARLVKWAKTTPPT